MILNRINLRRKPGRGIISYQQPFSMKIDCANSPSIDFLD